MNITISAVTNGYIINVVTRNGQVPTFYPSWEEVLKQLNSINPDKEDPGTERIGK